MFRWLALAAFLACLTLSTYYRRRARMESEVIPRDRETSVLVAGRVVIALPLFAAVLTYLLHPQWMTWAELSLPNWVRAAGVALALLTVPAAYWVFTSLGSNVSETVLTKTRHALVTNGPYRWVRHPLYTTGATLLLAIGLTAANWFILLFACLALVAIRGLVIPLEEAALISKFGEEYRAYIRRTGCLLPRLGTPRNGDGR
jgi:protein-S-isoprenylcysteine O-methyltransferase Ste14